MMGNFYFRPQNDGYARDGFATSTVEVEERITVVRIVARNCRSLSRRQFKIKSCSSQRKSPANSLSLGVVVKIVRFLAMIYRGSLVRHHHESRRQLPVLYLLPCAQCDPINLWPPPLQIMCIHLDIYIRLSMSPEGDWLKRKTDKRTDPHCTKNPLAVGSYAMNWMMTMRLLHTTYFYCWDGCEQY